MKYDEFVGQVQQRARLGSSGEAVTAIRSTLETLGQRLAGGAAGNLAAQLPQEIGRYLTESPGGTGERLGLDDFYMMVSVRESRELPEAVFHAKAVMAVLKEAVSDGEWEKIRAQFPDEYDPLFEGVEPG
ncbi:MAG: DUF2267 domain-containing protein [Armatimonadetes bacterium]|nr:DUF2267 domain-containing protein [Armatimonadota bacterium]